MKPFVLLAFFLLLLAASCGSLSSFESPNRLRNIPATLYLTNGKSFDGKLVVQTGNFFGPDVKLYHDGEAVPMHFAAKEVKGYRVGAGYYALKEREGVLGTGTHALFMKRLTAEGSRLHLYEAMEREPASGKGSQNLNARYQTHYYIEFPNEKENIVYAIDGGRLVPHFEKTMSAAVADCPALAKKISAKQDGYFYAQVSLFKTKDRDVLLRIIDEYNRCPGRLAD